MVESALRDVTPVRLRLLLLVNCLLVTGFCSVAITTIHQHEHAARTIGLDATPSVVASEQIQIAALEMDYYLINELLIGPEDKEARMMTKHFDDWRGNAFKSLIAAANNITYGDKERLPIESVLVQMGHYGGQAQKARDLHANNKESETLAAYRLAKETLTSSLLPETDALHKANSDILDATYSEEQSKSALSCGFVLVTGMVLIGLLVYTQVFLRRRFRRRFNVFLVVSTVAMALLVNHLYSSLRESAVHLKAAKEDAYDSMVALLNIRVEAYEAQVNQIRALIDRENAEKYHQEFDKHIANIATFPGSTIDATIALAKKQAEAKERINLPNLKGSLKDEFDNIKFDGEGSDVIEATEALRDYLSSVEQIRNEEKAGAIGEAIDMSLGFTPNSCKFAFTRFDDAIGRALKTNVEHFNRSVKDAFDDLSTLVTLSQVVCLSMFICIYLGLRDRIAEYMNP
jgi:hypothetical protein